MAVKNTTQVLIDGKIITLSGYESPEYLQKVASTLDRVLIGCRWTQNIH